ncbi:hypothetical protein DOTSEDRAFT_21379 [Dothistroma septosporum NZE10]|uniref:Uncharacterized protein n=1 Tax=Dothistroma septosporum (strain NZE10 / CBS 128990) TaxID=675120 RepID=N1PZJ7_DOTSN|nr:hypothetical protein DOTSEDRAFT_21379 [Dothistroma septosporum NZE10]
MNAAISSSLLHSDFWLAPSSTIPDYTLDAATWFKVHYMEDGSVHTQTGMRDKLPKRTAPNIKWHTSKVSELVDFPLPIAAPAPFNPNDKRHFQNIGWNQMVNCLPLRVDINDPKLFALADSQFRDQA